MSEPLLYWFRNTIPISAALIPGTDEKVHGNCREDVFKRFEKICEERGLKFDNIFSIFDHACCMALSPGQRAHCCSTVDESAPEIVRRQRLITWDDIKRFFVTLKAKLKSDEVVPEAEVERRAGICACCPHNQPVLMPGGCPSCSNAPGELANFVAGYKSSLDGQLKSCDICGCYNASQIHFPLSALKEYDQGALTYPDFCWKR